MPGKRSMYTPRVDGELKMRVISALKLADDSVMPTIEWIKEQDFMLMPHSSQKLSRILGSLVDMGVVKKAKSRSLGKMVYRLTEKMADDGYDVEASPTVATRAWNGVDWALEDEVKSVDKEDNE